MDIDGYRNGVIDVDRRGHQAQSRDSESIDNRPTSIEDGRLWCKDRRPCAFRHLAHRSQPLYSKGSKACRGEGKGQKKITADQMRNIFVQDEAESIDTRSRRVDAIPGAIQKRRRGHRRVRVSLPSEEKQWLIKRIQGSPRGKQRSQRDSRHSTHHKLSTHHNPSSRLARLPACSDRTRTRDARAGTFPSDPGRPGTGPRRNPAAHTSGEDKRRSHTGGHHAHRR